MNNEKEYYKSPMLFSDDLQEIQDAIIIAQNYYGSQRTGVLDRDAYIETRINDLERVLNKFIRTPFKELPTPPNEEI
jgi:hypothetical protein